MPKVLFSNLLALDYCSAAAWQLRRGEPYVNINGSI